jgi:FtsH-binding integral membrane protein
MEFSFTLPSYIERFINIQDAGMLLIFCCCFGLLILAAILGLIMKPYQHKTKLYIMVIVPMLLTWPISSVFTVVLNALDIEAIKIITMIMIIYLLMLLYCLFNLRLMEKYIRNSKSELKN